MTTRQLAEYLQLSERSVYRLLERGEVPALRVGSQWRFRRSEVDRWLETGPTTFDPGDDEDLDAPPARSASSTCWNRRT